MKVVNFTHVNGIAKVGTIAFNLRNMVRWANNASTKVVVRYDQEPGSKTQPVSYTLDISKATLDALVTTDAQLNVITADVLNPSTGVTTSTSFNEKYLVSLRNAQALINGVIDTSVVEFIYSDGSFINKTVFIDGTLEALVASNQAEILTYSFAGIVGSTSVINAAARTIAVTVPALTVVTAIVSTFTVSANLTSIVVGTTPQVSAATANDFSDPIIYVLTAADGVTQRSWTVTVTVAA